MTHTLSRRSALAGGAAIAASVAVPRRSKAADQTIRIGVLTDMAGAYAAQTGPGSVLATQFAVDDFRKQHPEIKVEVLSADMQLKPDVALAIAGDWFDNKGVDLLMDLPLSSAAIAVGEMVKAKDKLAIYTGAASSILTGERCGPNHLHWAYDTWSNSHAVVDATVREGGDTWFFVTADYAYGQQLARDSAAFVTAAGGKVLGEIRHPFPGTTDFSSFLLAAKASGAKVIAFANGGTDADNCIKQAAEFGLVAGGTKVVGVGLLVNSLPIIGLQAAQGVRFSEPYYWDMNDGTRAFGRRFHAQVPGSTMPNSAQAGQYSATAHYLKAVKAMGPAAAKASGRATITQMKAIPVKDQIYGVSEIRDDGRVIHPVYLLQAKKPSESKETWDVARVVSTIPTDQAYRPISEGKCPMIRT
ncbi:ABC transporter substrate-binding protein [Rhodopila sp.]|uniref:ABC transporter substrate-binding protein n=1 Tax=Rhodopila sp. TaxID=2480087 RepID=UPI002B864CA5|nr:ABC transporter substrate-binding protein [Rhodopila sp.]HVZ10399.1 ABC transporter substrate-binding protein [Rhodopila sp.]